MNIGGVVDNVKSKNYNSNMKGSGLRIILGMKIYNIFNVLKFQPILLYIKREMGSYINHLL